jgi:hypothetical protein
MGIYEWKDQDVKNVAIDPVNRKQGEGYETYQ